MLRLFLSSSVKFEPQAAASAEREGDQDEVNGGRALNGEKGVSNSSCKRDFQKRQKYSVSCLGVEKAFQMTFPCQSKAQNLDLVQLLKEKESSRHLKMKIWVYFHFYFL